MKWKVRYEVYRSYRAGKSIWREKNFTNEADAVYFAAKQRQGVSYGKGIFIDCLM